MNLVSRKPEDIKIKANSSSCLRQVLYTSVKFGMITVMVKFIEKMLPCPFVIF